MERRSSSTYERIYAIVRAIPQGSVSTYGAIAQKVGLPHGARQVGYAMRAAPDDIPWQRVVGLSRRGFARISIGDPMIAEVQQQILESEGVTFTDKNEIDLAQYGW